MHCVVEQFVRLTYSSVVFLTGVDAPTLVPHPPGVADRGAATVAAGETGATHDHAHVHTHAHRLVPTVDLVPPSLGIAHARGRGTSGN